MKDVAQIDTKQLREAVAALNGSDLLSTKVKAVGIRKGDQVVAFVEAIDNLDDAAKVRLTTEFPTVAEFYNDLIRDELEGGDAEIPPEGEQPAPAECVCSVEQPVPAPAPEQGTVAAAAEAKGRGRGRKAAQATPAAEPAPANPPTSASPAVERTAFGHAKGSLGGFMDELLMKGTTIEAGADAIASKMGKTKERGVSALRAHIPYLKKKGFTIEKLADGAYKYKP